jgi:hypothetical protein
MSIRTNLRRGRSHIIIALVMAIAGTLVVRIEEQALQREIGKTPPDRLVAAKGLLPREQAKAAPAQPADGERR